MQCKNCGAQVDSIYRICPYCNSEIEYPNSNKQVIIQNIYNGPAPQQPQPTPQQDYNVSSKDKLIALILCVVLGFFGVHYFYVGKVGKGILYLFTYGLLGIGWIIDIISIASGNFTDQYGLPLK